MLRKSPASVSEQDITEAISEADALATIRKSKPSVEDYVAEGVLDHAPAENAEGQIDVQVKGHDRVVRMLQMNEEYYRKESDHFDARRESGRKVAWRERQAERKARKFFRPSIRAVVGAGLSGTQYRCDHGHTFRFLTLGMDEREPTHPCVRDGCTGLGRLERA